MDINSQESSQSQSQSQSQIRAPIHSQTETQPSSSSQIEKKSSSSNRQASSKEAKKEQNQASTSQNQDQAFNDSNSNDSTEAKQPRSKQGFISCDNCRKRKIKCIRDDEYGGGSTSMNDGPNPKTQYPPGPGDGPDLRCVQCKVQGKECRFDYVLKKPGPRT